MDWLLCDDAKDYDERVILRGDEAVVKAAHQQQPGNIAAYVEDPDGRQYDYNPGTGEWDVIG